MSTAFASGYRAAMGIPENAALAADPRRWVELITREYLWSKQREICAAMQEHRYVAVASAHDTGKSFIASRLGCHWLDTRPDPFLVTTAPTWKQVNSILWREMRKAHRKGKLKGRINLDAEWYINGDELIGFGRKPADYDQAAFQGIHALNVAVIIDEACGVPKSIFEAADSLATNFRARVLAIGNPDDPSTYFAEICKPGSGWHFIEISAFDTPAFTDEEVPEYLYDLLVSPEWVEERKKRWGVGSPIYQSKVLGKFPEISDYTLFTPKIIRVSQANDLSEKAKGDLGRLGVDVARFGDGKTAVYRARGGRVRVVRTMHMADTMETANFVAMILRPFYGRVSANVDVIGVGGGVFDRLKEMRMTVSAFNSSESAWDTERFINRRAEAYWLAREMGERGELDLPEPGEDDDLIAQLGSIRWKVGNGGRIQIESKEDMKARGMPSPDLADAAIMALVQGANIKAFDIDESQSNTPTSGLRDRPM